MEFYIKKTGATNTGENVQSLKSTNQLSNGQENFSQVFDIKMLEVKGGMFNLTRIGQHFGKDVNTWKKAKKVREFVQKLDKISGCQNLQTRLGDGEQGTFATAKVTLKFAEYISTDFEIWTNSQIDTLLQTGRVELQPAQPANQFDFLRQMLDSLETQAKRVNQLEQTTQAITQKVEQLESEPRQAVISVELQNLQQLKGYRQIQKNELGRSINDCVNIIGKSLGFRHVVKDTVNDEGEGIRENLYYLPSGVRIYGPAFFQQQHRAVRDLYVRETKEFYPGADVATLDQKQSYQRWLNKFLAKNQLGN